MKSLDRNSLDEQTRLVARYVAGDLSRSERGEFEAWLIASPELAAEVEMERRLRRGMASAARRGWLSQRTPARTAAHQRWHLALAASVLVAVGLAVSLNLPRAESSGDTQRLAAPPHRASALNVRLGKVRGAIEGPDIRFTLAGVPAEITLEPDVVVLTCANGAVELECAGGGIPQTPQYSEYELDLVNRRGNTLAWRSARQEPTMGTELSFTMRDPSVLNAGDYDVVVRGISADHAEVVGRFWLQVGAN
jgi:ferric-dicitrate binding protein FerR (iron transport regulator)